MKRQITAFLLCASMACCLTGCKKDDEIAELKKQNEELRGMINKNAATQSPAPSAEATGQNTLAIGEKLLVTTKNGKYNITITGAKNKTLSYEKDKPIIDLSYEVENVDFKSEQYTGCTVNSSLFYAYDDKQRNLVPVMTSGDDMKFPGVVLPGYKGDFDIGFYTIEDTKYVDIIIHRPDENGDKILAKLRLDLN